MHTRATLLLGFSAIAFPSLAPAQTLPPPEQQIAGATVVLPEALRAGATVLGYQPGAAGVVELRRGTNPMVCLADDPGKERFHVACYPASLEPFMARGRELRAQDLSAETADSIRLAEVEAGTLSIPEHAALYAVMAESFDPATREMRDAQRWFVIYTPYATPESTGLPTEFQAGAPWLMDSGTAKAHVMIVLPKEQPDGQDRS